MFCLNATQLYDLLVFFIIHVMKWQKPNRKVDPCRPCHVFQTCMSDSHYEVTENRIVKLIRAALATSFAVAETLFWRMRRSMVTRSLSVSCITFMAGPTPAPPPLGMAQLREIQTPVRAGGALWLACGRRGKESKGTCHNRLIKCSTIMVHE